MIKAYKKMKYAGGLLIMNALRQIDPTCAVCFSGHRPDRILGEANPKVDETQKLIEVLQGEIKGTIKRGKDTFINGFMAGWDILAAEQISMLKEQYPHIKLVSIAPYEEHFFTREKCWTKEWVRRAEEVWRLSDIGVIIAERYRAGIYYERNRILVNHSTELICYWDGGGGGTKYTVEYANSKCVTINNLYSLSRRYE